MAHITGGGLQDNLNRILPAHLNARIDRTALEIPAIFHSLRRAGDLDDQDMMRTFNMGAGMVLVVAPESANQILDHLANHNAHAYSLGEIVAGQKEVEFQGELTW